MYLPLERKRRRKRFAAGGACGRGAAAGTTERSARPRVNTSAALACLASVLFAFGLLLDYVL